MIAPTSCDSKVNWGMSGCPTNRPSAKASASPSTGYLRESVRNGGASGCGLAPAVPVAWQRAQFLLSRASPRFTGARLSCADNEGTVSHGDHGEDKPEHRFAAHGELAPTVTGHIADLPEQRIPQQRFLDDGNRGFAGALAHKRAGVAGDQDRRR